MKKFFILLAFFILVRPAWADDQTPVEISATGSLAWQRGDHAYVASGGVIATKGDMTLACDTLTARYTADAPTTDITTLTAQGHVHFTAQGHEAFGDLAVYDMKTQILTLTGENLKLVTPDEIVTARDKIDYIRPENRLNAVGYAKATKGQDTISADRLSAFFDAGAQKSLELRKIQAENNVVITTAKEKVFGTSGVWDAKTQKATLEGPVQIEQGQSRLTGDKVVVDMRTGMSQLLAEGDKNGGSGRVKGVFYPAKKETGKE